MSSFSTTDCHTLVLEAKFLTLQKLNSALQVCNNPPGSLFQQCNGLLLNVTLLLLLTTFLIFLCLTVQVGSLLENSENLLLSNARHACYPGCACYSPELHHSCQELRWWMWYWAWHHSRLRSITWIHQVQVSISTYAFSTVCPHSVVCHLSLSGVLYLIHLFTAMLQLCLVQMQYALYAVIRTKEKATENNYPPCPSTTVSKLINKRQVLKQEEPSSMFSRINQQSKPCWDWFL